MLWLFFDIKLNGFTFRFSIRCRRQKMRTRIWTGVGVGGSPLETNVQLLYVHLIVRAEGDV